MKRHILYRLIILTAVLATSCVADLEPLPKGWLHVSPPSRDTSALTRTTEKIDYLVSIQRGSNLIISPVRYSQLSGPIPLSEGTGYNLIAESCTKTEAENQPSIYGQPRYAGSKPFSIEANISKTETVKCSMANAAFCIVKDESFYYPKFKVTATLNDRILTFTNKTNEGRMGYFNVGEDGTAVLDYKVEATDSEGRPGTGKGTIQLKARTLSRLHLKATDLGYIGIEITYDDTFTPSITNVVVTP